MAMNLPCGCARDASFICEEHRKASGLLSFLAIAAFVGAILMVTPSARGAYCDLNGERIEGALTPKQCRLMFKDQINGVRVYGVWRVQS